MSITIKRPSKKFKGAKRSYVKVNYDGKSERCMLDTESDEQWENIKTLTIDRVEYTQRSANEDDVKAGNAAKVGELIDDPFSRLEVTDYELYSDLEREKKHELRMATMDKRIRLEVEAELDNEQVGRLQNAI